MNTSVPSSAPPSVVSRRSGFVCSASQVFGAFISPDS